MVPSARILHPRWLANSRHCSRLVGQLRRLVCCTPAFPFDPPVSAPALALHGHAAHALQSPRLSAAGRAPSRDGRSVLAPLTLSRAQCQASACVSFFQGRLLMRGTRRSRESRHLCSALLVPVSQWHSFLVSDCCAVLRENCDMCRYLGILVSCTHWQCTSSGVTALSAHVQAHVHAHATHCYLKRKPRHHAIMTAKSKSAQST